MKPSLLFFLSFLIPVFSFAQTQVGGGIFTPTVWELAGSPYQVTSDVVIFPDQSLTIEPGVVVEFNQGTKLENRDGDFIANGSADQPILFTSAVEGQLWKGIVNTNLEADILLFEMSHFIIEYAETGIDFGAEYAYQTISNAEFRYNDRGVYDGGQGYHWIQLYDCVFSGNGVGMEGRMSVWDSTFEGNDTGFGNPYSFQNSEEGGRVINCTFIDNGIAVGTIGQIITFAVIEQCSFEGNGKGVYNYWAEIDGCDFSNSSELGAFLQKGHVRNSTFTGNAIGIDLSLYPSSLEVMDNDIVLNEIGIRLNGSGALVQGNTICGNTAYNAISTSNSAIDVTENCWCTSNDLDIQTGILDAYDDVSLGILSYNPVSLDCLEALYPGDANRDGEVNGKDILFIGMKLGMEGQPRDMASTDWLAQFGEDWDDQFLNGINTRFADANGDGVINEQDLEVVLLNQNLSHGNIAANELPSSLNESVMLSLDLIEQNGNTLLLGLNVASELDKLKGISLGIEAIGTNSLQLNTQADFSQSFWLDFTDVFQMNTEGTTNPINISAIALENEPNAGSGELFRFELELSSIVNEVELQMTDVLLVNTEGYQLNVETESLDLDLVSISNPNGARGLSVYPNPANDKINITYPDGIKDGQIVIYDVNGKLVKSAVIQTQLDLSDLEQGLYMIGIHTTDYKYEGRFLKL